MSTAPTTIDTTPNTLAVPADLAAVRGYVAESLAESTRRAYRAGLAAFRAWCDTEAVAALPASPETVAAFLAAEADAGLKVATLEQRVAAIRWAHEATGCESPTAWLREPHGFQAGALHNAGNSARARDRTETEGPGDGGPPGCDGEPRRPRDTEGAA